MNELEELKKEIKLLREKIEKLEVTPKVEYHYHYTTYPQQYPTWEPWRPLEVNSAAAAANAPLGHWTEMKI